MKHILISGASSLIINGLIDLLLKNGFEITGITRNHTTAHRKDIQWIEADLSVEKVLFKISGRIDLILHAAAISNSHHASDYESVNFNSTVNMVELAKGAHVPHFVYISSILAGKGCGLYGESKARSEAYIKKNMTNWTIIRPAQVYGYSKSNPINKVIQSIISQPLIFCPGSTIPNLYPIIYSDLLDEILNILLSNKKQSTWIILGPGRFNFLGLVKHIRLVVAKRKQIVVIPGWILLLYYKMQKKLKIPFGPPPDQIFRLYYANPQIDESRVIRTKSTISDYLKENPGLILYS